MKGVLVPTRFRSILVAQGLTSFLLGVAVPWGAYGQIPTQRGAPSLLHSFPTQPNSGQMLGSVAVGNVDDDPALEIVVNSRQGIDVYDFDGTVVSSFSTHNGSVERLVNAAPSLWDIDGDGRKEILFATSYESFGDFTNVNTIYAIDGENGTIAWSRTIDRGFYSSPNSGYQTIENRFYYDGAEHTQLPIESTFTSNASALPIHDIDDDGVAEVVVNLKIRPEPFQDYNPYIKPIYGFGDWGLVGESWSGGNLILEATTGARDHIYHFVQLSEAGLALGVVDDDLGTAVFSLTDSDSVVGYHKNAPHGFNGAGNLIGQFGKNSRIQSGSYKKSVSLNAVDLTGDGKAEILYEGRNIGGLLWQGSRVIFDSAGRILWRRWYDFPETSGLANIWPNAAQMIPLNLDGGNPEVLSWHHTNQLFYEEWNGVDLVSKTGSWPASFGSLFPSPPAVGDIDGDGEEEIVVALYDPTNLSAAGALVVMEQDGSIVSNIPTARGLKNVPSLADVDDSGDLDIVVRDVEGTVLVFDTQGGDPSHVTWATEYRNTQRTGALGLELYPPLAPRIDSAIEGFERVELNWSIDSTPGLLGFTILRKEYASLGVLQVLASLPPSARSYEDTGLNNGLNNGVLYVYHVEADWPGGPARSAPIPAVPLVEGNLAVNSAIELNGNRGWDKWYTGDIGWEDMTRTETEKYRGEASMRIHIDSLGNNSSIKQWNQYGVIDAQLPVTAGEVYSFGAFMKTDLDRPSEHFIEWGSSYDRWRNDPVNDPIPSLEWPFYFTPHIDFPAGESDWVYTNRTFTVQTGITAVAPRHRFLVNGGPMTGDIYLDEVFFRKVGTDDSQAVTYLPLESDWRYFDGAAPGGWYQPAFDDGSWPVGQAKFGAGSGPDDVNTPLPQFRDQFYFRHEFSIVDPNPVELVAYGLSTTGPNAGPGIREIYLNGTLIPTPDPGLTDNPGNEVRLFDLSPFIHLLEPGTNLIAIKLENEYTNWDDLAFDFQLRGLPQPLNPGHLFSDGFESGDTTRW
jgi:hypothetical protein